MVSFFFEFIHFLCVMMKCREKDSFRHEEKDKEKVFYINAIIGKCGLVAVEVLYRLKEEENDSVIMDAKKGRYEFCKLLRQGKGKLNFSLKISLKVISSLKFQVHYFQIQFLS